MASDSICLFEVGPRDGLQNQSAKIATDRKVALINLLSQCGLTRIEATAFVSPKWVPQLADAAEVLAGINRKPGIRYAALTPNLKGYERAHKADADEVAVFAAASEGFSQKNINCSIAESLERFEPVMAAANKDGIPVRGYVSCVVACPYDGPVAPSQVARVAESLLNMGCYEISLGDTIGSGNPETVAAMLEAVVSVVPPDKLAGHFHDTGDNALGNIEESLRFDLRTFDTAVGGLGGCPYAHGAKGNVDTRAVAQRLAELGFDTGVDTLKLAEAEHLVMAIKQEG
ncbi:MAG: hydroxymethylglutaryl-CoA lyase [Rhodospirillales bacterium]|jgi:hydroxymethylglutaryl-CoA lyase|nr:hydroxymethylglutaryl-CoA lyase [Rhodospirillales bacterium]MBT4039344.1 hydroxymethylglutaryl-CoA lyase [Rhodospirillales bacterium]MBT4626254.1 hydroxymethylglutaryl-CoA lyase [Rhodospirillales bacterium]MBT5353077.1 hydroxymethylglutaryl-CoA lyase [Rhodospirillales bacterium]MBT5520764.1 hydroxymethylglutaryl-CoA lyase [Rhodospirillales bacterium]